MYGENGTYFTPGNCLDGHFILVGPEDVTCNDLMQITSTEYELSRHLREQGFEAVVFYNSVRMTYCYDEQSAFFIRHNRLPDRAAPAEAAAAPPAGVSGDGPLAALRRRAARPPQGEQPQEERLPFWAGGLSLPEIHERLRNMLTQTRVRCAVVFSNMDFSGPEQYSLLACLEELSGRNFGGRNIAVYMMRESSLCNVRNMIHESSDPYRRFLRNVIEPRVNATDPYMMRVIFLARPNAREIRNVLLRMRLTGIAEADNIGHREQDLVFLKVEEDEIDMLAFKLADECGLNNWTLLRLIQMLKDDARTQKTPLSIHNWQRLTSQRASRYLTAAEELNALVGLEKFKRHFQARTDASRYYSGGSFQLPASGSRFAPPEQALQPRSGFTLNVALSGDPGTGKTTVARLISRIYHELGLLSRGHTVDPSPGSLLGVNEAMTAEAVHAAVLDAIGGVLFIDEIYTWTDGHERGGSGLGQAAINQLTLDMSVYAGQLAVVVAGYKDKLRDLFRANQGLASRFPENSRFELDPYTGDQLNQIFHLQLRDRAIDIPPELETLLPVFFKKWSEDRTGLGDGADAWGNAREVDSLTNAVDAALAARFGKTGDRSERRTLTAEDFPEKLREYLSAGEDSLSEIKKEIDGMIGLSGIKQFFDRLITNIMYNPENAVIEPGRFTFMGPPGTGKTEVAKNLARLLWRLGLLKRRVPEIVKAKDLIAAGDGADNGKSLSEALRRARGGLLFIDEAHQLLESDTGRRVITELVPIVEDPEIRRDTAFVLAGYTAGIEEVLKYDEGLGSRFPEGNRILFKSYTAKELTDILDLFIRQGHQTTDDPRDEEGNRIPGRDGFLNRTEAAMERYLENNADEDFGNARFMRETYLREAVSQRSRNLRSTFASRGAKDPDLEMKYAKGAVHEEEKSRFTKNDLPAFAARLFRQGDLTLTGRTPEDALNELIGKEAFVRYAAALKQSLADGDGFTGNAAAANHVYVVTGPFGCGKETAVRAFVKYLNHIGLLERDACYFAGKGDMEGEYIGHSAPKTRRLVNRCKRGGLAIVSPISLTERDATDRSFGPEAMNALLSAIAQERASTAFFFIDTADNMQEVYRSFPRLKGLVQKEFAFQDLLPGEMETLFRRGVKNRMVFEPTLEKLLPDFFVNWTSDRGGHAENPDAWANGDEVENLISSLRTNWELSDNGVRAAEGGPECAYITADLFPEELRHYLKRTSVAAENALQQMQSCIGMQGVKDAIRNIHNHVKRGGAVMPGCYAFLGNPGTGKTMMAGYMGAVLKAAGALKQGHVVIRTAHQLDRHPGQWEQIVKMAKNGVLFIDEAYLLSTTPGGRTVIEKLLTTVEDAKIMKNLCIIVAGYEEEMENLFFAENSGLSSRFGSEDSRIRFEDYSARELVAILKQFAARAPQEERIASRYPLEPDEAFLRLTERVFESVVAMRDPHFGNARFVRNYLKDCYSHQLQRLEEEEANGIFGDEFTLTARDVPSRYRLLIRGQEERRGALLDHGRLAVGGADLNALPEQEWMRQIDAATVLILVYENDRRIGSASGSIVSEDGVVLTCHHVVTDQNGLRNPRYRFRVRVNTPGAIGGDTHLFDAELLHEGSAECDMALLKIQGNRFPCLALAQEDERPQRLEGLLVKGYPLLSQLARGNIETVSSSDFMGSLASVQRFGNYDRCFIDCSGKHGNSGSPVFSLRTRKMIGVFSGSVAKKTDGLIEEINYFYPVRYFWSLFVGNGAPSGESASSGDRMAS